MNSFSKHLLTYVGVLCLTMFFMVPRCAAQTQSAKIFDKQVMSERIAVIFRETLKQGEGSVVFNGQQVKVRTYMPPRTQHVVEIQSYGDEGIPIIAKYLSSGSGFEKYLAMRFLGLIGSAGVVEPLTQVALNDTSSSFRLSALGWLSVTPWDLASPTIRHIAVNDSAEEVRELAKEILERHQE